MEIFDSAAKEKLIAQCPQTKALRPLPPQEYPEIAMAMHLADLKCAGAPTVAELFDTVSELATA